MQTSPFAAPANLDRKTYERIRQLVFEKSGISLKDNKETLVTARLSKRIRDLQLNSYGEYLQLLQNDKSGSELTTLLDAISTNVTYFFRESDHFDIAVEMMRTWRREGQQRFRLWSAACSTGEEPYSLAMSLADLISPGVDLRILATDISTKALTRAMAGAYTSSAVDPVPAELRRRFFTSKAGDKGETFVVKDEIKKSILFRHFNLIQNPLPLTGPLDLIFCRNVMIYFEQPLREQLVREFARLLKPGGVLMISHSESLVGIHVPLRMIRPSVYRKVDSNANGRRTS